MKTNIGVHFEEAGSAVTNLEKYVRNLVAAGYSKVAATNTASFTQYEDVKGVIEHIREKEKDFKLEIIPAVQCYIESPNEIITLIAKNHEGYLSLCKIITQSNEQGTIVIEDEKNANKNKPIVYIDNLRKNVSKGNLIVTTGGEKGVFCQKLSAKPAELQKKIKNLEEEMSSILVTEQGKISYSIAEDLQVVYKQLSKAERVLKKEFTMAERYAQSTGDYSDIEALKKKQEIYEDSRKKMKAMSGLVSEAKKAMTKYRKQHEELIKTKAILETLDSTEEKEQVYKLYNELSDIFGEENLYIELQNHKKEEEKEAMNELIAFAKEVGNEKFVVGNDIRVGVQKEDETFKDEMYRLDVAYFINNAKNNGIENRFYEPLKEEEVKEYCIKTEEEYIRDLRELIKEEGNPDKEKIIAEAIKRTEEVMETCVMVEPPMNNHYPSYCENAEEEFEKRCKEGILQRFPEGISEEQQARLEYEINIIKTMGYSSYHLIVQDYLNYARLLGYLDDQDIPNAPLTIEELEEYIESNKIERIGIGIGPGRGSAAGSLCCYALGITDIDPLKYGLLFERFLNPERVSMPDIDSDFRPQVRYKAREYVKQKYGEANVCEIVTKSYHGEKGCIHDIARYQGKQLSMGKDKISKERIQKEWDSIGNMLAKRSEKYKEFEEFLETEKFTPAEQYIIDNIPKVSGFFSGFSQHAAGVIISKDAVSSEMPLMWSSSSQSLETQCQMADAEKKGYLKMDFLGLRNLAVITDVVKQIDSRDERIYACQDAIMREKYILNNKEVIKKIFSSGLTQGVFQFESQGMKKMLKDFAPESFEDIILLVAAYRPGPLDYIPEIIATKWYKKDPTHYIEIISKMYPLGEIDENGHRQYENLYPTPQSSITLKNQTLQDILKSTYNCPIYQEQIMQIFQKMAGYSLGRADEVRRAMSKKKEEKLKKERINFIYGNAKEIEESKEELEELKKELQTAPANQKPVIEKQIEEYKIPIAIEGCIKKHGITEEEADKLFEQMMPFAKYGFNKSHATAYAVVSMETAYLKAEYPKEFYASALTHVEKREDLPKYISEMSTLDIPLYPPSLESKADDFKVEGAGVRYPIAKAKGFKSTKDLIPSRSIFKFILSNPTVSKKQVESLAKLGVFNSCWYNTTSACQKAEICRTNTSITGMTRFINEYYDKIQRYGILLKQIKEENPRFPLITKRSKTLDTFLEYKTLLKNAKIEEEKAGKLHRSDEEIMKERATEYELLNHVFSVEKELKILKRSENQNSFQDFENPSNKYISTLNIPCVVVCVDYKSKTTKKGSVFYNVTLMDRNGEISVRRFNEPPTVTKGIFKLQSNPYFFCNAKPVQTLNINNQEKVETQIKQFLDNTQNYVFEPVLKNNVIEQDEEIER